MIMIHRPIDEIMSLWIITSTTHVMLLELIIIIITKHSEALYTNIKIQTYKISIHHTTI